MGNNGYQIIFDVDGVLVRSDILYMDIAKQIFNVDITRDDCKKVITKGGEDLFNLIKGCEANEEDIARFRQAQIDLFEPKRHLFDRTVVTIKNLSDHHDLHVLSNKPVKQITGILSTCRYTQ